jgi:hypothetical protein
MNFVVLLEKFFNTEDTGVSQGAPRKKEGFL